MTGDEYETAIKKLGMRKTDAARFFNVNETTARRWIKGSPIPIPVVMLLRMMVRYSLTPDNVVSVLLKKGDLR